MFSVPAKCRVMTGKFTSSPIDGNNGLFFIDMGAKLLARCIASDGMNWEHVSVSLARVHKKQMIALHRCPTWEEMCIIKAQFWADDDVVIQYHPTKAEHVSYYDYCLHLWRPSGHNVPTPHHLLVGPKP